VKFCKKANFSIHAIFQKKASGQLPFLGSINTALVTQADSGTRGDWLSGEDGNDWLFGSYRGDMLFGGSGSDTLIGGAGDDLILGDGQYTTYSTVYFMPYLLGQTQSWIWSDTHAGFIGPLKENDYWQGAVMRHKPVIHQWQWKPTDDGQDFDITLADGSGFMQELRMAPASDNDNDLIDGGEGNDWIAGQRGHDTIYGGPGNDILFGDDPSDTSIIGHDSLFAGPGADKLYGGPGDDYLDATDDDNDEDLLYGGDGDDLLKGGTGGDKLYGEAGDDTLVAGDGDTHMEGGSGNDTYYGGDGNDTLVDESGDDRYSLSAGQDSITDTGGNDEYYLWAEPLMQASSHTTIQDDNGIGSLHFEGQALTTGYFNATSDSTWESVDGQLKAMQSGQQLVFTNGQGGEGKVIIQNFFTQDVFLGLALPLYNPEEEEEEEEDDGGNGGANGGGNGKNIIHGTQGDDDLQGTAADDEIYGYAGNDILHGGDGDDLLDAGDGDDVLQGGSGNDILKGGLGNDHYHITPGHSTCIDIGGWDTYVIHLGSLMQGGTASIQDSDGMGDILFDGQYLNAQTVFAAEANQWHIQGNQGLGILHREGQDLHIHAQGYSGNVVVEDFFSSDVFLNVALPAFEPLI